MAKLYATLETSKGKTVSVCDNEEIIATVYDGNMKAYSVHISWTDIGDPEHMKCNHCNWEGDEIELLTTGHMAVCPECKGTDDLETIPAEMGAIITTREWRNETEERRKRGKIRVISDTEHSKEYLEGEALDNNLDESAKATGECPEHQQPLGEQGNCPTCDHNWYKEE